MLGMTNGLAMQDIDDNSIYILKNGIWQNGFLYVYSGDQDQEQGYITIKTSERIMININTTMYTAIEIEYKHVIDNKEVNSTGILAKFADGYSMVDKMDTVRFSLSESYFGDLIKHQSGEQYISIDFSNIPENGYIKIFNIIAYK